MSNFKEPITSTLISAIVLTYNEEINIEDCLISVAGWCKEIFVVDSGSTDRTVEICRKYTSLIYTHPFIDSATQWDWSLKNLPIKGKWILPLDADYIITDMLRQQLIKATITSDSTINGYYSRHQYYFQGVPMYGVKPYAVRLFRPGKVRMDHSELVDFRFVVEGKTSVLTGVAKEVNKKELSIDFWIDKQQKFSTRLAVEEILRASADLDWSMPARIFGNHDERMIWLKNIWYSMPLFVRPFLYFIFRYFFRFGFLTGWTGLLFHFLHAFWFRIIVDMKILKLKQQLSNGEITLEQLKASFVHRFEE